MATRMLIDASYPEETRVVVVKGKKLAEFDFETASRRPLKGNIYLAKVTRVEPSLQAAFVDYGGNRHGFLAFSEFHPDYYQIPIADRQALIAQELAAEEQAAEAEEQADDAAAESADGGNGEDGELQEVAPVADEDSENDDFPGTADDDDGADEADLVAEPPASGRSIEAVGGDALDEVSHRSHAPRRTYKIQEVIKRRQILLVQVVKEERGNKGAALTTYMSLAGRYCVLMPNTGRGGGISRKITSPVDRKRLKVIAKQLDLAEGMGVIVRTAGLSRNKSEIKRDFEYLLKLWDQIRELTLKSSAPCLIYEEANQIKRAIRDLYGKDIEEILVEGEDGYRTAKGFMRMLMPSHAKRVQPYKDRVRLFQRYEVEQQLDAMYSAVVNLPAGGYVVLNPTEALVAIDVNSGKSTKEHNIEETALKTNLEAAEEVARQLRLRDLAGLIVIDFIDMEVRRNNRTVENKLKECLRADRARIQVGRISPFGLLEMSRQRLRPGVHEINMEICSRCGGAGVTRSTESTALHVLRAIEEEGIRERSDVITVTVPRDIAIYILNQKRNALADIEARYGFSVMIEVDDKLIAPDHRIERSRGRGSQARAVQPIAAETAMVDEDIEEDDEKDVEEGTKQKKRRRRRRRKKPDEADAAQAGSTEDLDDDGDGAEQPVGHEVAADAGDSAPDEVVADDQTIEETAAEDDEESPAQRRRRRGRRGGRRRTRTRQAATEQAETDDAEAADTVALADDAEPAREGEAVAEPQPDWTTSPAPVDDEAPELAPTESADAALPPAAALPEFDAEPPPAPEFPVLPAAPIPPSDAETPPLAAGPEAVPDGSGEAVVEPVEPISVRARSALIGGVEPHASPDEDAGDGEPADDDEPKERRSGWWRRRG